MSKACSPLHSSCGIATWTTSTEWYPYAAGLGAYTLPLICAIDPQAPAQYLDRTTGLEEVNEFHARLQAVVTPAHVLPDSFPAKPFAFMFGITPQPNG
jgi:hypothetical protein